MPHYKDLTNKVHFLDDPAFAYVLPVGSVQITDQEAAILQTPPNPTPAEMWERIKAERDRRMSLGAKVAIGAQAHWFHTDTKSRIQHLGLKDAARDTLASGGTMSSPVSISGQQIQWKCMGGMFVPMTVQVVFDLVEADKQLDAALHLRAEQHKALMEASPEPWNYDYSTGWPEVPPL